MIRQAIWESRVKECLDKIDSVDSLAFDVSVARHAIEEGDYERARTWLDPTHAIGEMHKAYLTKLLEHNEFERVESQIYAILSALKKDDPKLAHEIIVDLQEFCITKAYLTFTRCVVLP